MSLQQAALLTQNPLLRGLQAGQSAYNSPLATSIEASLNQAQQQRASLGLNPASSYPVSGTSAARPDSMAEFAHVSFASANLIDFGNRSMNF